MAVVVLMMMMMILMMMKTMIVRRDTGTYSCTATNDLGQSAPGYVDVETHCE